MTTTDNMQAIIDVATVAYEPQPLERGAVYAVPVPVDGQVEIVDLDTDDHRGFPRRKSGTVHVHSAASFIEYLAKHGMTNTEVYADAVGRTVVAVVNAGDQAGTDEGVAGFGDHRVVFNIIATKAWKDWVQYDGKMQTQEEFSEFIEDHLIDIVRPSAADMLEIAQSIQVSTGTTFESSKRLSTGQTQFEYREESTGTAGGVQRLEIPQMIELGIAPFEGSATYKVDARFRYRLNGGNLKLSYKLVNPEDRVRDAFAGVVADIREGVTVPVFDGTPQ